MFVGFTRVPRVTLPPLARPMVASSHGGKDKMLKVNERVLVIEVGGTSLRSAWFDAATRRLTNRSQSSTPFDLAPRSAGITDTLLAAVDLARRVAGPLRPELIVVAWPGPVDGAGWASAAPTVAGAPGDRVPVAQAFLAQWPSAAVRVLNDLTAAGHRYVAEGSEDFCILTIGSGIGHKIFERGKPIVGPRARGGEIGHLRVERDTGSLVCDCGGRGHLGAIASGRGMARLARVMARANPDAFAGSSMSPVLGDPDAITEVTLVAAFHGHDPLANEVVTNAAQHLGWALAALHVAAGVERFIIIGGMARALGDRYRAILAAAAAAACWDIGQAWDDMVTLGYDDDDHGLLGAGHAALSGRQGLASP